MRGREATIGDVVTKCSTWNPKKSTGKDFFDYLDLGSVDKDAKRITGVERHLCSKAPSRARQVVKSGDVLVASVRPNLNGVALVQAEHEGMVASTGFCVLRPMPTRLNSEFLFHWVKTPTFVQRMLDVATGANYPAVSDAKVRASKIPLPPLVEQERIAGILDVADALRAKRREVLAQLDNLRQSTFLDMFGDPVTNPMAWEVRELGSLAKFINGDRGTNYPSKTDFVTEGVPFINAGHLRGGKVDFTEMNYISRQRFNRLGSGKTKPGDVIYCLRGSLGKAAVVSHVEDSAIASSLVILRVGDECVPEFLYEYLVSPFGQREIRRFDSGSSQPNLAATSVKKYSIPLPPLDLQHRFAAIVESIEDHKARLHAYLAELHTLFASLQSRAFAGDL